jgi:hypothetical protein
MATVTATGPAVRHATPDVTDAELRWRSLKSGLYQIESSIPKVFLSGEAESIGDREGKFWAKDANDKPLVSESTNFRTQQDAVARIGTFLADCKEAQPAAVRLPSPG